MTATATKIEVALDSPLRWTEKEHYRTGTIDFWRRLLLEEEIKAEALPRAFDERGELIEENVAASKEILARVGGLVVASYRGDILRFDRSVLLHMDQAAEVEVPAFIQTREWAEVAPKGAEDPPGETIFIGSQINMIRDRLGEA